MSVIAQKFERKCPTCGMKPTNIGPHPSNPLIVQYMCGKCKLLFGVDSHRLIHRL